MWRNLTSVYGKRGRVSVFEGADYEFRRNIDFGEDPDNLRYDPVSQQVLDLKTGGHPESFQLDAGDERLFVNVPDAGNVVEAFDLKSGSMTRKWTLGGLRQNYAMAVANRTGCLVSRESTRRWWFSIRGRAKKSRGCG